MLSSKAFSQQQQIQSVRLLQFHYHFPGVDLLYAAYTSPEADLV